MDMNQAKKLYRQAHGIRTVCPACAGKEAFRAARAHRPPPCCSDGTVLTYPPAAPGFRTFARSEFNASSCTGKLAAIVV